MTEAAKDKTAPASATDSKGSNDASKAPEEAVAEEDAFEEFEAEDWNVVSHEDENKDLWQADWDDEDILDDFQSRLMHELDGSKAMKE